MDFDTLLFWFVCLSCLAALPRALMRFRDGGAGWVAVFLLILATTGAGGSWKSRPAVYAGSALWFVFVLAPALLSQRYLRLFLQQRYRASLRVARVVSWLHPAPGQRQQLRILRALELADAGDITAAVELLQHQHRESGPMAATAVAHLYRLTNQWVECLTWLEQQGADLNRKLQLIPIALRARGETGDLSGLVQVFDRHEKRISQLEPAVQRHLCRLILFAFCGRHEQVERLLKGPLDMMPSTARGFWLGTTELASGRLDGGRRRLLELATTADPVTRRAIEWRLSHPPTVATEALTPELSRIVDRAELEQAHEARFATRPSLFSRTARACQMFIALNVLGFLLELKLGASTNVEGLFRLGGLATVAVTEGEWWRLLTANFLHFGVLHLTMNMLGIWALGPWVEFALGFRRFVLVYLASGIGAMGIVLLWLTLVGKDELLVGASACVMGLIGSTGAILLRGWQQHKARIAVRRLVSVLVIVGLQTLFDWAVPQVSMTAHLSGVLVGFLTTMLFKRDSGMAAPTTSDGH